MSDKKKMQLGMNPSTAANRLVKDVLWKLIQEVGRGACCKCGEPMSRETFSIEHVAPWLDSEDPVGLYFDLSNISFSHHSCNVSDARRNTGTSQPCGTLGKYDYGCRCDECKYANSTAYSNRYCSEKRRERYLRNGK